MSSYPAYGRQNPSPRYQELVGLYRQMHIEGERARNLPPEQVFPGRSILAHALAIKELIDRTGAQSLLDYGAGKGMQYQWRDIVLSDGQRISDLKSFWGILSVTCYDAGWPPFNELPCRRFDGVICTDVLEHCPEPDIEWILHEIFGFADKFVYGNIACHLARATLPNGENAHCTARPESWWMPLLRRVAAQYPGIRYRFVLEHKMRTWYGLKWRRRTLVEG
jgi:hypothetical protein